MKKSPNRITFGMMNHPAKPLRDEILLAKQLGFDFLDLTLEPPITGPDRFDLEECRRLLKETKLGVVGHTGWHLPGNAAYPEVRHGVAESLLWAARHFSSLGAKTMTYHICGSVAKYIGLKPAIDAQVEILSRVAAETEPLGVRVVLEHINGYDDQFALLDALFRRVPALGFHLDVGHANLNAEGGNLTGEFFKRYGDRLCHVHISDNRGRHDDHMPLGVGSIDWPEIARLFKRLGYNRTITLEVFSEDPEYVAVSLRKAREWFL